MNGVKRTLKLKKPEDKASFVSWRFALLCGCILLALGGLLSRVAWLQVINPDKLVKEGDLRSLRVQAVPTARGMISDRGGRPLAVSVPVNAIWADPKELHDAGGVTLDSRWKALSDALSIPIDQLAARVNANPKGRFIYLARQVNPAIGEYVKKLKLPLKNSSCRAFTCAKSPVATIRQGRSPHTSSALPILMAKALKASKRASING